MQYPPLIEGRLLRRYKRFFADVEVGGEVLVTHCANPGSMRTCAPEGARVWISESNNPKRKLRYTWELVEVENALISVNTLRANALVEEALEAGVIAELGHYSRRQREVRVGETSRIDFLLSGSDAQPCYLEVKSVTLWAEPGVASFPDSVTKRGTRHLRELMDLHKQGIHSALLFCVARTDPDLVRPADEIDPAYGDALREAQQVGVQILAYRTEITPQEIRLATPIPVDTRRLQS